MATLRLALSATGRSEASTNRRSVKNAGGDQEGAEFSGAEKTLAVRVMADIRARWLRCPPRQPFGQ
eukprot:4187190-Pleurochrysis_carterae.AAC.1